MRNRTTYLNCKEMHELRPQSPILLPFLTQDQTSNDNMNLSCPSVELFPSLEDFQSGLGAWAVVLYVSSAIIWTALGVQYVFLIRQFVQKLESARLTHTLWVTSVFFFLATCNMVSIILPLASEFIWLAYKVCSISRAIISN